ncbi:hypothetical protein AYI69_g7810 [Smittium culicis]|uniref:Uncharacterized protein n=1 Tax=Smittium culicis TaxID=133412 RepID=A0A1R1XPG9_9FUNG|nr:hypothetical protein AYI69_g7810 [Smittium culicis]
MSQEINFNSLAEFINGLKMEVQELRKEKASRKDVEMEDENYVVRLSIVNLNVPKGLIGLIPHIDEDFYKSIGSEEETKEMIQACPRSSTMNYSPPPLNERITSAAKKTNTTLYGIQIALAQANRPLENFVYRKYKEDSKTAKKDEGVALASAMRLILASIATNISQIRMENKLLNKAISTTKPVKKARLRKSFQMRQQYDSYRFLSSSTTTAQIIQSGKGKWQGERKREPLCFLPSPPVGDLPQNVQESLGATHGQLVGQKNCREGVHDSIHEPETAPTTDKSSSLVQEEAESGSQSGTDRGNSLPIIQESNRGGRSIKPEVLKPTLLYPQEDRAAEASLGFKKSEQVCSGKELQDGVSQLYLQVNHEEGLHDVHRSEIRLPPHPDTQILSKVLKFRLKWPTFPVQSTASTLLGTENGDQNSSLLGRSLDYRRNKGTMQAVYHRGPEQAHEAWVPGKLRKIGYSADTNDKSPGNDHKLPRDDSQGAKGKGPGTPSRSCKNTECRAENAQGTGELHWKSSSYSVALLPGRFILRRLLELKNYCLKTMTSSFFFFFLRKIYFNINKNI